MPAKHVLCQQNEVNLEIAHAVMATSPTLEEASERLKTDHGITVSPAKLAVHKRNETERYDAARKLVAPQLEALATNKMLDVAHLALAAQETAIVLTKERMEDGHCADPSKVARDLADVMAKNVDKKLALEGRPTQIVENRDTSEIINALVGMGVAKRVDATVEDATEIPA